MNYQGMWVKAYRNSVAEFSRLGYPKDFNAIQVAALDEFLKMAIPETGDWTDAARIAGNALLEGGDE